MRGMPSNIPPLTTWVIMLKRRGNQKRHRARSLAKREIPRAGDIVEVTDDDGTKLRAIVVGFPRYYPPDAAVLGWYIVEADEA
jgi:hypothetical protein